MAEVIGAVASVFTLLEMADKIVTFGQSFADAPKEMQQLVSRLESLQEVLKEVEHQLDSASEDPERRHQVEERLEEIGKKYGDFTDDIKKQPHHGLFAQVARDVQEIYKKFKLDSPVKKGWRKDTWIKLKFVREKGFLKDKNESINSSIRLIDMALHVKGHEKMDNLTVLTTEYGENSKFQMTKLSENVSEIMDRQEQQDERQRQEAEASLRRGLIAWLSPFSFIAKREDLYRDCFKEVGDGLWQDQVFLNWVQGRPWILQCKGRPMVGKTVLSSMLDHRLHTAPYSRFLVLSVFLDVKSYAVQTETNIIASLLKQILQQDDPYPIPQRLKTVFERAQRHEKPSTSCADEILDVLKTELKHYDRVYVVVDGFDEFQGSRRTALRDKLRYLDPERVSILIFTRDTEARTHARAACCDRCDQQRLRMYFSCQTCRDGKYTLCLDCKARGLGCLDATHQLREPYRVRDISVEIPPHDIERYVEWQIGLHCQNERLDDPHAAAAEDSDSSGLQVILENHPHRRQDIIQTVSKKAKGQFLTAKLYMEAISSVSHVRGLNSTLRSFPDEMNDIYEDALRRLEGQRDKRERALALQILGFIARARRPFSRSELVHALAITDFDIDHLRFEDFEEFKDAQEPVKSILNSTAGLVIVGSHDAEVRLVHRSLDLYVRIDKVRREHFASSDAEFAKACLTYMNMVLLDPEFEPDISQDTKYPFLKYVSQYWGDHVREAVSAADTDKSIQKATVELIKNARRRDDLMRAAWKNSGGPDTWDVPRVQSLHICAWYGLSFAIEELNLGSAGADLREPKYGQTPLMYACRKGHKAVVQQLLALGASFAVKSARGRTAMHEAVANRHDELVEFILEANPSDLDINAVNEKESKRSVLMLAARETREIAEDRRRCRRMVEALLMYPGIDVDQQDFYGMTALYIAAKYDNIDILKPLLEARANLELGDFEAGRSPLRLAAERNYVSIVRTLLDSKADPNAKDRLGASAIFHAARQGAYESLEVMLAEKYGGDLRTVDELGQSLLHCASVKGHFEVIRRLIAKGLDPNLVDHLKRTPLHIACQKGQKTVVSLLLDKGADPGLEDENGRTPKTVAWQYGYREIVEALQISETNASHLQSTPIPPDTQLPLWAMAHQGLTDLLYEAVTTRPHDLATKEPWQLNTAVQCAIEARQHETVELLLSLPPTQTSLPINSANRVNRTALHTAALYGDVDATRLLLGVDAIDIDIVDRWHSPALELAQSNWHPAVMLELVKAGAAINEHKIDAQKLFFYAVQEGDVEAVQVLLNAGVDRSAQDQDGLRAEDMAESDAMKQVLKRAATVAFEKDEKAKGKDT